MHPHRKLLGVKNSSNFCVIPVEVGDAILWNTEEWHEVKTDAGLKAVVIESDGLNPAEYLSIRDSD